MAVYVIKPPKVEGRIIVSLEGEYACVEHSPGVCRKVPREVLEELLDYWWHKGYEVKLVD